MQGVKVSVIDTHPLEKLGLVEEVRPDDGAIRPHQEHAFCVKWRRRCNEKFEAMMNRFEVRDVDMSDDGPLICFEPTNETTCAVPDFIDLDEDQEIERMLAEMQNCEPFFDPEEDAVYLGGTLSFG